MATSSSSIVRASPDVLKKQGLIALSSTEAEFIAGTDAAEEL